MTRRWWSAARATAARSGELGRDVIEWHRLRAGRGTFPETLAFLEQHVEANTAPLCGNSVWQDRRFLARYMPTLAAYLHYRIIDVSSRKELVARWRPELLGGFSKANEHTALADIRESIGELRYYREHFFRLA